MVLHFLIQVECRAWLPLVRSPEASQLDLRGWVRNTEDGEVEVVASGDLENWQVAGEPARWAAAAALTASSSTI